jgi:hypothetical protein
VSRYVAVGGILLALVVAIPHDAEAQGRPQTREGFFIGFGFGYASFSCEGCGDREDGVGGHLKLGGTLSPSVLIGAESSAWTKDEGGSRITHGNLSAIIQFYPMPESGFFLKGGAGFSRLEVSASGGGFSATASDEGFGFTAGAGYDVRVGDNFSLSPYGSYQWGDFEGGSANHFQVGLGVTWH